ncbi:MAG: UDP-N-acetylmuramate:L-alanyl-gamma-D-glutamyl-meso-diaminopimelate ligase [Gammaproteobacteria bacterium]|nr:UDP-N-acetylmuramate:L-alanyl-gamma-D-glutamyl-meso-diaminopimelate ligase [Gammaproteobacteria bacterium]
MHLHILGICGTFMGGIALLARALGHTVSGQDANVYPPMSTQLAAAGIALTEGYAPEGIPPSADVVVIGNAMARGNPAVEYVLDRGLAYTSGPQWLAEHVLAGRFVIAVAGTHGKTTTTAMIARILEYAGLAPGFLIGGVPQDFGLSARLGATDFFVVEADEYDTAFFDKRSKFVHYRPRTAVLNNLEYDHADIFPDLAAIQRQFHHLVRTVPGSGLIVAAAEASLDEVLGMGCWTPVERIDRSDGWQARSLVDDGSAFDVYFRDERLGRVEWSQLGRHNVANALAAIAAARHAGVAPAAAIEALGEFQGVKRRMEVRGCVRGVTVYDDFAHHPTAVATTLDGLRKRVGSARILAVLEPRSNTMRLGVHRDSLADSLAAADRVFLYQPVHMGWDLAQVAAALAGRAEVFADLDTLVGAITREARQGEHVLVMSNGGFGGIHQKLLDALGSGKD